MGDQGRVNNRVNEREEQNAVTSRKDIGWPVKPSGGDI